MATSESEPGGLSLGLLNINGLREKTDDIKHIIKEHQLHVLALCETKLNATVKDSKLHMRGFRMWRMDRDRRGGGGLALYVHYHIRTELRRDLMVPGVEMFWVQMLLAGSSRLVLLGCCYRPSSRTKDYLDKILKIMKQVSTENKDIFLMGDFNINWSARPLVEKDKKALLMKTRMEAVLDECGLTQIVAVPTRVTEETSTCIDHIYTNIKDQCFQLTSIQPGHSDHKLITVRVRGTVSELIISRRLNETFSKKRYMKHLRNTNWTDVTSSSDPGQALCRFSQLFDQIANEHAPLTVESIYASLELGHQAAEQRFWRYTLPPPVIHVKHGRNSISEEFLKYLKQGSGFTSETETPAVEPAGFHFQDVDDRRVQDLLSKVPECLDGGVTEAEAELFRLAAKLISGPIGLILNTCIRTGVFPSELKKMKLTFVTETYTPIYQDTAHLVLGLMLHVILLQQLKHYITVKELIPLDPPQDPHDHIELKWLKEMKAKKSVHVVFVDLSSSFDSISQQQLTENLEAFGLSGPAAELIRGFLFDTETERGLTPGSFFADFLLTVYINDLKKVLEESAAVCDNQLIIYYTDDDFETLPDALKKVFDWAESKMSTPPTVTSSAHIRTEAMLSESFRTLGSVLLRDQSRINWITALKVILQHSEDWSDEYKKKLEEHFTRTLINTNDLDEQAKESVVNYLVLSEFES